MYVSVWRGAWKGGGGGLVLRLYIKEVGTNLYHKINYYFQRKDKLY